MVDEIRFGKVTIAALIIISLIFLLQQFFDFSSFYFSREFITQPWVLVTSLFLHANLAHVLYNAYALFIFGSILEANTSSKSVFITLLLGGIIGNLGFALFSSAFALGFSGAVYALIGAVTLLLPNTKIPLPFGIILLPVKAKFAGPFMLIGELILSVVSFDNIAHSAHAFGFLGGALVVWWVQRQNPH
ncbi:hypothetical protein COT72_02340 [archaeon CG10_big_fil_rev_8_21_14_0_10_43_11]|nr:MAG: hypothetical protein COT72_02340 [archaeon CG10_big_fil_rev_8_21_14_0_10_43_11]